MKVISTVLEPAPDGNLHLPLPPELLGGPVRVNATLEAFHSEKRQPVFGCLAGKISLSPEFDAPLEDLRDYME